MMRKCFAPFAFLFFLSSLIVFSGCFGELTVTQEKLHEKPTPPPDTTIRSEFDSGLLDRVTVVQSAKKVTNPARRRTTAPIKSLVVVISRSWCRD